MSRKHKKRKLAIVLATIIFLIGIIFCYSAKGLLEAKDIEQEFVKVKSLEKTGEEQNDLVHLELIGTIDQRILLPENDDYEVYQTNKEQTLSDIEVRSTHDELSASGESTDSPEAVDKKGQDSSIFYEVDPKDEAKKECYLDIKKDKSLYIAIKRKATKEIPIVLYDSKDKEKKQTIFMFKQEASHSENKKQAEDKGEKNATNEQDALKQLPEALAENPVPADSEEQEAQGIQDELPVESEEEQTTEEEIAVAETKATSKSVEELEKGDYTEKDSLRSPVYIEEKQEETKASKSSRATTGPIIVKDAKMTVRTGTAPFDSNNNPGYDMNDTNDIVRSFDSISYLVSFSIQNTSLTTNYTNIRYRVTAKMSNAVEMISGKPAHNGEIANGTYINNADGSKYSQGIMESTIADTGQVFVPVILSVYGATNGKQIQPTITLEIVDAVNKTTGKTETLNNTYTSTNLPVLAAPITKVSSTPSVQVELKAGGVVGGTTIFGGTANTSDAYDIGAVIKLKEISGRSSGDFKGSTFPTGVISYRLKHKVTYNNNVALPSGVTAATVYGKAISTANPNRSAATWVKNGTVTPTVFTSPLDVPNGATNNLYMTQPTSGFSSIGVFNSGTPGITAITASGATQTGLAVSVNDYVGVNNPYTYSMANASTPLTTKSFVSNEIIVGWDKSNLVSTGTSRGWNRLDTTFFVDSVTYNGKTDSNNSSLSYPTIITNAGAYISGPIFTKTKDGSQNVGKASDGTDNLINLANNKISLEANTGNAHFYQGDSIYLSAYQYTNNGTVRRFDQVNSWDPTGFKFDTSRSVQARNSFVGSGTVVKYGVAKVLTQTAPYTMNQESIETAKNRYNWYTTPAAAQAVGPISAVFYSATATTGEADKSANPAIPVIVLAATGSKNPSGKAITVRHSAAFYNQSGTLLYDPGNQSTLYKPTIFNSQGIPTSIPSTYANWYGESGYVDSFGITTSTDVKKDVYQTSEEIDIKVRGAMKGAATVPYGASLTTTLPKGISYKLGSATDASGVALPNPTITSNSDGTSTLLWNFSKVASITTGVEVNFKATSDFTKLTFKDTGYTENLNVKTVGQMWPTASPTTKDTSAEVLRTSNDTFVELLIQQVILSKSGDKPNIEVGITDASGTVNNDITYTVKMVNNSAAGLTNTKLLDVLPYNGDSRGSVMDGSYTVKDVKVSTGAATVSYSNAAVDENTNPNSLTGWTNYTPGTTPVANIANAKAIMVTKSTLAIGETVTLTVTISPKNQKAGNKLVNNATMNSALNLPVSSQPVITTVYGRDLSGVAWYDDSADGLIGAKPDGTPEEFVKDIPVKLYRTSLVTTSYKDQLVKESLTGQAFVDSAGNSLIKTDENGKYTFENLPEGTYVAEFMVGDKVVAKQVKVTKQLVGSDATINSKANQTTYKTPNYTEPKLADLASKGTTLYHVPDVNIGLLRPSKIRLFKYEAGTAIDKDGDGKLSEEEMATGTPLKGAEFSLHEGTETGPVVGTGVTDENGIILFDTGVFPGEYVLVETKAPEGFELIKKPITITVGESLKTVLVYKENMKQSILPNAGGTKFVLIALIIAISLLGIGFVLIWMTYRKPKVRRNER